MIHCDGVRTKRETKTKRAVEFPDLVLQAIMRGLRATMRCTYYEVLVQHSGDGAGGILDSEMRKLH